MLHCIFFFILPRFVFDYAYHDRWLLTKRPLDLKTSLHFCGVAIVLNERFLISFDGGLSPSDGDGFTFPYIDYPLDTIKEVHLKYFSKGDEILINYLKDFILIHHN